VPKTAKIPFSNSLHDTIKYSITAMASKLTFIFIVFNFFRCTIAILSICIVNYATAESSVLHLQLAVVRLSVVCVQLVFAHANDVRDYLWYASSSFLHIIAQESEIAKTAPISLMDFGATAL